MFDPLNETIMDYVLRKAREYPNKRDLIRESGEIISDWNLSKMLRGVHSPRIDIVQPLFKFFIEKDEAEKQRIRKTSRYVATVN